MGKEPDELRREIDEVRADIGETVAQLSARVSPSQRATAKAQQAKGLLHRLRHAPMADSMRGVIYAPLFPFVDKVHLNRHFAVTERGRAPGQLYRFECDPGAPSAQDVQDRMYEAGAGVIDLDHLLVIGRHFGGLPDDVVAVELEPHPGTRGDQLSAAAQALLPQAVDLVRREVLAPARVATKN